MTFSLYGNHKMRIIVKNEPKLKDDMIREMKRLNIKHYKRKNVHIGLSHKTYTFNQSFWIYSDDAKIFDDFAEQIRVIKN